MLREYITDGKKFDDDQIITTMANMCSEARGRLGVRVKVTHDKENPNNPLHQQTKRQIIPLSDEGDYNGHSYLIGLFYQIIFIHFYSFLS